MVDAWQGFSLSEAIRVAKVLEKYEITWFEEPILSYDFDGLAMISRGTTVPIVCWGAPIHEQRKRLPPDFKERDSASRV